MSNITALPVVSVDDVVECRQALRETESFSRLLETFQGQNPVLWDTIDDMSWALDKCAQASAWNALYNGAFVTYAMLDLAARPSPLPFVRRTTIEAFREGYWRNLPLRVDPRKRILNLIKEENPHIYRMMPRFPLRLGEYKRHGMAIVYGALLAEAEKEALADSFVNTTFNTP